MSNSYIDVSNADNANTRNLFISIAKVIAKPLYLYFSSCNSGYSIFRHEISTLAHE